MTDREASFYKWLETFTLFPEAELGHPHYETALGRGYVVRRGPEEVAMTAAGWEWFAVRSASIITRCGEGHHDYRPKTPFCVGVHCRWCGACETAECRECRDFLADAKLKNLLTPTYDLFPRSPISHLEYHADG